MEPDTLTKAKSFSLLINITLPVNLSLETVSIKISLVEAPETTCLLVNNIPSSLIKKPVP